MAWQTNKSAIQRHSNLIKRKPRQKKQLNWAEGAKCAEKKNDVSETKHRLCCLIFVSVIRWSIHWAPLLLFYLCAVHRWDYCKKEEKQECWTGKGVVKRHQTLTWLLDWRTEVILGIGMYTKTMNPMKKGNFIKKQCKRITLEISIFLLLSVNPS